MRDAVHEYRADIGIALDGDADRVIICDEAGRIVDGDQIIATIATFLKGRDRLKGGGVVSTIMSNMGLERYLDRQDLRLERTRVGDRYVVEAMREMGMNVGGEPSGHVVLSDHATTGDGLLTALQILAVVAGEGIPVSEACHKFDPFPQILKNIKIGNEDPLNADAVKKSIADAEAMLGRRGRLVIRKSGTEPLVRVMGEGEDNAQVEQAVDAICDAVRSTLSVG